MACEGQALELRVEGPEPRGGRRRPDGQRRERLQALLDDPQLRHDLGGLGAEELRAGSRGLREAQELRELGLQARQPLPAELQLAGAEGLVGGAATRLPGGARVLIIKVLVIVIVTVIVIIIIITILIIIVISIIIMIMITIIIMAGALAGTSASPSSSPAACGSGSDS